MGETRLQNRGSVKMCTLVYFTTQWSKGNICASNFCFSKHQLVLFSFPRLFTDRLSFCCERTKQLWLRVLAMVSSLVDGHHLPAGVWFFCEVKQDVHFLRGTILPWNRVHQEKKVFQISLLRDELVFRRRPLIFYSQQQRKEPL